MNNDYAMSCVDLSRVFYRFFKLFSKVLLTELAGLSDWVVSCVPLSSGAGFSLAGFPVHKGEQDKEEGGHTED